MLWLDMKTNPAWALCVNKRETKATSARPQELYGAANYVADGTVELGS